MSDGVDDGTDMPELPAETGPERTCIVTRTKGSKDDLIRFVLGPDMQVVPDIRAKLPGRGAWVLANAATMNQAIKKKAFARAFKAQVTVGVELAEALDALLQQDALQSLSFANKAGLVICGTTKVESAIATKPLIGLVHAVEAGQDGIRKLDAAMRRRFGDTAGQISRVQLFASSQLDLALGRTHVIHASLTAGAAGEGFLKRSHRLERYRGLVPLSTVGPGS